jgi:hypothetical protein
MHALKLNSFLSLSLLFFGLIQADDRNPNLSPSPDIHKRAHRKKKNESLTPYEIARLLVACKAEEDFTSTQHVAYASLVFNHFRNGNDYPTPQVQQFLYNHKLIETQGRPKQKVRALISECTFQNKHGGKSITLEPCFKEIIERTKKKHKRVYIVTESGKVRPITEKLLNKLVLEQQEKAPVEQSVFEKIFGSPFRDKSASDMTKEIRMRANNAQRFVEQLQVKAIVFPKNNPGAQKTFELRSLLNDYQISLDSLSDYIA